LKVQVLKSQKGVTVLDSRKLKILSAVVDEYILKGEPVGSKAIMNYVSASSATIRNEMAELEKQGYLEQPHTSAGRVPTYKGYRLYVDSLMEKNPLSASEMSIIDEMFPTEFTSEDELVDSATTVLAEITKCAAVASNTSPRFSVISKLEVIPTGKRMYVLLMITSNGSIKNKVCRLEFDLTNEQLEFLGEFIAQNLEGMAVNDISEEMLEHLEVALGTYMVTLSPLIAEIYNMSQEMSGRKVKVAGETNLIARSEYSQNEIISFLENRTEIARFLDESFSGLHVMFSPETDSFVINNSSLITSPYSKKGRQIGTLGLIGPMRIDYRRFIPYLEYMTGKITELISGDDEEDIH